jgi:hypothetical protein
MLWQAGLAWSSVAAVVDASTGRRIVLSWFVLPGPICVLFTGRWVRTAVAGAWATCLVVVLGIPDGIWGTHLESLLIGLAVLLAVCSTLALAITFRRLQRAFGPGNQQPADGSGAAGRPEEDRFSAGRGGRPRDGEEDVTVSGLSG